MANYSFIQYMLIGFGIVFPFSMLIGTYFFMKDYKSPGELYLEYVRNYLEYTRRVAKRKNKEAHRNRVKPSCYPKPHFTCRSPLYRDKRICDPCALIRKKCLRSHVKKRLHTIPLAKKACAGAQHGKQRTSGAEPDGICSIRRHYRLSCEHGNRGTSIEDENTTNCSQTIAGYSR